MAKHIEIPFQPSMKKEILIGKKKCTSRNKKYGNPTDYFIIENNVYQLTLVLQCTLEEVANEYYKEEGFESPENFIIMWNKLHPILGYVPTKKVYTHWFELKK